MICKLVPRRPLEVGMLQLVAKAAGKAIASSPNQCRWIENPANCLPIPVNIPCCASMLSLSTACFERQQNKELGSAYWYLCVCAN